jgi:hypothetical protein
LVSAGRDICWPTNQFLQHPSCTFGGHCADPEPDRSHNQNPGIPGAHVFNLDTPDLSIQGAFFRLAILLVTAILLSSKTFISSKHKNIGMQAQPRPRHNPVGMACL